MKLLKIACWIVAILLILCGIVPFFYSVFLMGSLILFVMAVVILAFPFLLRITSAFKWLNYSIIAIYIIAFLVVSAVFISMINQAYFKNPPLDQKITAITLGAKVNGNQPSLMLRNRLLVTKKYLDENPSATAIMTGGQGADEDFPEGLVMAAYLEGLGIDSERIFIEDRSTNTLENLTYAIPLIPSDSEGVVIISDDFHQKRASMLAQKVGIQSNYSLSSRAPIGLIPMYWARDMGGVLYTWFAKLFD